MPIVKVTIYFGVLIFVSIVITQVSLPLWYNTPIFPIFRRRKPKEKPSTSGPLTPGDRDINKDSKS